MDKVETRNDQVWDMIKKEKQRDKSLKVISWVSWGMTLVVLSIFMIFTVTEFSRTMELYRSGFVPYGHVLDTLIPMLVILGSLSLLVAILVTIGRFMRLRTTNLLEVQQRLTHLENLMTSKQN